MRMKRSTTAIVRGGLWKTALQNKQPSTGDEEIEKRNAEISAARKRLLISVSLPLLAVLLILTVLLLLPKEQRVLPAEGEFYFAVPAENALLETVDVGDMVRFYDAEGQILSMRYVMVASTSDGSMTVLLDEMQLCDYLNATGNIAVIPVLCGNSAAAQDALTQQRLWNAPKISLSLSMEHLTLEVGQTARIEAETAVTPADATRPALLWASSDEAVVTVAQNGTIEAIGAGTASITATCGEAEASCTVTVLICADALSFDAESYNMAVGQTLQLPLMLQPENATEALQWSSSDEAIATVGADGVVAAHSGGSVTITAEGAHTSASCTVNVSVPAKSVVLNSAEMQLTVGGTGQLAAVVMPENASDKTVTWASSDEAILKVGQDGTIRAVAAGTATVTATCGEASASCTVTVSPKPATP